MEFPNTQMLFGFGLLNDKFQISNIANTLVFLLIR